MSEQSKLDRANQLQEKYDLYFLTLTFTLLGLAIQTVKFGTSPWPIYAELVAWVLLVLAGIAGAARMVWFASVLKDVHKKEEMLDDDGLHVKKGSGVFDFIFLKRRTQRNQRYLGWLFWFQAICFGLAIVTLVAARAYPAIEALKASQ